MAKEEKTQVFRIDYRCGGNWEVRITQPWDSDYLDTTLLATLKEGELFINIAIPLTEELKKQIAQEYFKDVIEALK